MSKWDSLSGGEKIVASLFLVVLFLCLVLPLAIGLPSLFLWLGWTHVAVPLFGVPPVTYYQAVLAFLFFSVIGGCFKMVIHK